MTKMLRTTNYELKTMGNKGFTLIEIIIVIVLAGVFVPAIVVPFVAGVKESGKPEMTTTAMYLAHQKMEEFMKFNYSDAALNPTGWTPYANTDIPNYQWQWTIFYVDSDFGVSGSDQGYKEIAVRVRDPESDTYVLYAVVTDFP